MDTDSEEYFDIHVEVGFATPLDAVQTVQALQLILDVFKSEIAQNLFEGISFLQLTQANLSIKFRYATIKSANFNSAMTSEDGSRLKAQFTFYLFAKIDAEYPLNDVPFPSNFRAFLSWPEWYLH
jgi:hypothetical protein